RASVPRRSPVGPARLEQQRVAPTADGPRLGAEHTSDFEPTAAHRTARGSHHPIDDAELIAAAGASLQIVLSEALPVQHQRPVAEHYMGGVHGGCVGKPGGARTNP